MTASQILIAHAAKLLILATLAGLLVRRRANLCWTLTIYLSLTLVGNSMSSFWPDTFHTRGFWILKQGVYDAMKMGTLSSSRLPDVSSVPGAQATARRVMLVSLVVISLFLIGVPTSRGRAAPTLTARR
jgi:hypothetical protein